jgi:hypothetical protein
MTSRVVCEWLLSATPSVIIGSVRQQVVRRMLIEGPLVAR